MANITIYSKDWCPYCANAKRLLTVRGFEFDEVDITLDSELEAKLIEQTGLRTVPQIFVEEQPIGGFVELARLVSSGDLDHLKHAA
ncbi:MAG: glutaredoxin domain-containing protein [Porticoccus sp.]|nr:glutaredoxin domain-containing protein [Porticoccus sp.]